MSQNPGPQRPNRILALCDSIVARPGQALTGFGRVALNLFQRWAPCPIDIWAVGFEGHNYRSAPAHCTLLPGGNHNWYAPERLNGFLQLLAQGHYTHVFLLMDPDVLSNGDFPLNLRRICRERKIRSVLYYPVDAPVQPPCGIITAVEEAITFTEYGRAQTLAAVGRKVQVLPHGIEDHFTPVLAAEERAQYRAEFQIADKRGKVRPFLNPGDFLLLNVNKNEYRKDPFRSLELLQWLRAKGVPAKLVLRMAPTSFAGGTHLERAAEQLGLKLDQDWAHIGPVPENKLRALYGAADLYLTASLGEGWGFGVTEALACGTPVAMPAHTSLGEIGRQIESQMPLVKPVVWLPLEVGGVCGYDTRVRHRVELVGAAERIREALLAGPPRVALPAETRQWLSWDRIAAEFRNLMKLPSHE